MYIYMCVYIYIYSGSGKYIYIYIYMYVYIHIGTKGKNLPADGGDARDTDLMPGLGRSFGEGNGSPLQYCCLGNPMDREAWRATIHAVTESWTCLK